MTNPEGLRRGIFGITPTKERTAPTIPGDRPPPVSPEPGKPPTKKPLIQRLAGNLALRIGLGTLVLGGAGYEAYREIPAIHQAIDQITGQASRATQELLPKGDPDKFTVSSANSIIVKQEEVASLDPLPGNASAQHQIYILFPLQGLPSSGKVNMERDLQGKYDFAPFFPEEIRKYAKEHNIRNTLDFKNVPENTVILAPIGGKILYLRIEGVTLPDTVSGAIIYFDAPDGTRQEIHIGSATRAGSLPLIQAEPLRSPFQNTPNQMSNEEKAALVAQSNIVREKLKVPVELGQPILRTLGRGTLGIGTLARPTVSSSANELYPTNISFYSKEGKWVLVAFYPEQ